MYVLPDRILWPFLCIVPLQYVITKGFLFRLWLIVSRQIPLKMNVSSWRSLFCFTLLIRKWSQRECYHEFQPNPVMTASACPAPRVVQTTGSVHPPTYTVQLLTLHQHRANNQYRMANQILPTLKVSSNSLPSKYSTLPEFSDRTRTGISKLISCCAQVAITIMLVNRETVNRSLNKLSFWNVL